MDSGEPDGRRQERLRQSLPIRVLGYDEDGQSWQELTATEDVSEGGASFMVPRPVYKGQVVRVALPMPKLLRQFDHDQAAYRVYAIVRTANLENGACRVGVKFLGKSPPRGFEENPSARFLLPTDVPQGEPIKPIPPPPRAEAPPEAQPDPYGRRAHPRFDIFVEFTVELVDEFGAVLEEERTVAENISKGGARLMTAGPFTKGEVIVLHEVGGSFEARAEVREVRMATDSVRRLHVRFLDGRSPEHLVRPR